MPTSLGAAGWSCVRAVSECARDSNELAGESQIRHRSHDLHVCVCVVHEMIDTVMAIDTIQKQTILSTSVKCIGLHSVSHDLTWVGRFIDHVLKNYHMCFPVNPATVDLFRG